MMGTLSTQRRGSLTPWYQRGTISPIREMEDLFERFWGDAGDGRSWQLAAPPLDMSETEKEIKLRMDLPGVSPNEIDVQVSGNQLTVSGERKDEAEQEGETFHRVERRAGQFSRSIVLPCDVRQDEIEAKYQDGVLRIKLPKTAEASARHIKISS